MADTLNSAQMDAVHHLGGPSEERVLGDVAAIEATLTDVFDLDLSGLDGLREVLDRFV